MNLLKGILRKLGYLLFAVGITFMTLQFYGRASEWDEVMWYYCGLVSLVGFGALMILDPLADPSRARKFKVLGEWAEGAWGLLIWGPVLVVIVIVVVKSSIRYVSSEVLPVQGDTMFPKYRHGEKVKVNRGAYLISRPRIDDVIVLYKAKSGAVILTRIVARPGDVYKTMMLEDGEYGTRIDNNSHDFGDIVRGTVPSVKRPGVIGKGDIYGKVVNKASKEKLESKTGANKNNTYLNVSGGIPADTVGKLETEKKKAIEAKIKKIKETKAVQMPALLNPERSLTPQYCWEENGKQICKEEREILEEGE